MPLKEMLCKVGNALQEFFAVWVLICSTPNFVCLDSGGGPEGEDLTLRSRLCILSRDPLFGGMSLTPAPPPNKSKLKCVLWSGGIKFDDRWSNLHLSVSILDPSLHVLHVNIRESRLTVNSCLELVPELNQEFAEIAVYMFSVFQMVCMNHGLFE